jgi:hypothetical protein
VSEHGCSGGLPEQGWRNTVGGERLLEVGTGVSKYGWREKLAGIWHVNLLLDRVSEYIWLAGKGGRNSGVEMNVRA